VGTAVACAAIGVPRAKAYRHRLPKAAAALKPRPASPRALNREEHKRVLDGLHNESFADKAPAETYAKLLDQGMYLCSIRTMERVLEANQEVWERRN
jgi:crotonobetainyl-CoA:carnitine CoA-transferase CaiB-like acyl-CoA transferase